MAVRYSGSLKIHVLWDNRLNAYKATVSRAGRNLWRGAIGAPRHLTHGVDSPAAYDETAHAALSFADYEGADISAHADYTDSGYAIMRSPIRRNPSRARKAPTRRTVKRTTKRRALSRRAPKRTTARRRPVKRGRR